jgi:hypothetical protein
MPASVRYSGSRTSWKTFAVLILKGGNGSRAFALEGALEFRFFPNSERALSSLVAISADILATHETLLGKDVSACVRAFGNTRPVSTDAADPRFFYGGGRVLITMNSLAGNSGMGWPSRLLWLDGASRDDLIRSQSVYDSACTSQEVTRTAKLTTISNSPFCMTTFFGFDNRCGLPPFVPVYRNQDGLFGQLVGHIFPESRFGYFPLALVHSPTERRRFVPGQIRAYHGLRLPHFIGLLLDTVQRSVGPATSSRMMRRMGRELKEFGSLPLSDAREILQAHCCRELTGRLNYLDGLLERHGSLPEFWAADVKAYATSVRTAITDPMRLLPVDVRRDCGEDALTAVRDLIGRFGSLVESWPDMMEAAQWLRERGQPLAPSVEETAR